MQSVDLPSDPGSSGQAQPLLSGPSPGRVREGVPAPPLLGPHGPCLVDMCGQRLTSG